MARRVKLPDFLEKKESYDFLRKIETCKNSTLIINLLQNLVLTQRHIQHFKKKSRGSQQHEISKVQKNKLSDYIKGPEIIKAFEESHERAVETLDKIEYLEGQVLSENSNEIVIRVFDKIFLNGKIHTYSDRLAVKAIYQDQAWHVTSIEHRPFEEERAKLKDFLASAAPKI